VLDFHSADVVLLASHLDALDLAASSSLGDAAHFVRSAAHCAAFSLIRLLHAFYVGVAFALEAGCAGQFDAVASSSGGGGDWNESVVGLSESNSGERESEKFHF
jgi:hypothetical protein